MKKTLKPTVTVCLPDFFWVDAKTQSAIMRDLALPSLRTIMAKANRQPQAPTPWPAYVRQLLNIPTTQGFAHSLWALHYPTPAPSILLQAAPVHLQLSQNHARVLDHTALQLSLEDAQRLCADLNHFFAEDGWVFYAPQPQQWFLSLPKAYQVDYLPLDDFIGQDAPALSVTGIDAMRWQAKMTELQMFLYTHPINAKRESQGQLSVNSVWAWSESQTKSAPHIPPNTHFYTNNSLLKALLHDKGACHALPNSVEQLLQACTSPCLTLVLDDLIAAQNYGDYDSYQQHIQQLEHIWLAPLLCALWRQDIAQLNLQVLSRHPETASAQYMLKPRYRYYVWRRAGQFIEIP